MSLFGKEKPIKEYSIGDRKFYLFELTRKRKKKLERNLQNMKAHLLNSNYVGWLGSLAEMAAIRLTPEGDHPDRKNIVAIREEILDLPLRFVAEVLDDIHGVTRAKAEARNKG